MTAPAVTPPTFKQLTFPRGYIQTARFGPDGDTIIYSAALARQTDRVVLHPPGRGRISRARFARFRFAGSFIGGELAVRLTPRFTGAYSISGTLARTMLSGGTPRPVENDIEFADWSPDGKDIAIVRRVAGRTRLEFPVGKVFTKPSAGSAILGFHRRAIPSLLSIIVSLWGDPGFIAVIDLAGNKKVLTAALRQRSGTGLVAEGR